MVFIDVAVPNTNAAWVTRQLATDTTCSIKSIILVAHRTPSSPINDALEDYFGTCGGNGHYLPTLTVTGNAHPSTYCLTQNSRPGWVDLTVEALRSGPIRVSIVRDENGGDYFHVDDADLVDSNRNCPVFVSPTDEPTPEVCLLLIHFQMLKCHYLTYNSPLIAPSTFSLAMHSPPIHQA